MVDWLGSSCMDPSSPFGSHSVQEWSGVCGPLTLGEGKEVLDERPKQLPISVYLSKPGLAGLGP